VVLQGEDGTGVLGIACVHADIIHLSYSDCNSRVEINSTEGVAASSAS
jgi:hypothetical protein